MYKKGFLAEDSSWERTDLFFVTIDHCIGYPHNAAATSVRDQPWVRVRGPAGPRTVTKMSKISGYGTVYDGFENTDSEFYPRKISVPDP